MPSEQKAFKANRTVGWWKIEKNRIAIANKTYFENGEHWFSGYWEDNNQKIDLPLIFFEEIINKHEK